MMRSKLILWSIMAAGAINSAAASPGHYAISATSVAAAINRVGVQVSEDQITFPADIVATTQSPAFKVRSIEKLDDKRLLARMECVNGNECLPFIVDIRVGVETGAQFAAVAASPSATPQGSRALVVHSGAPVILMLDDEHVHIRLPAICLQGGAPGQLIRVTSTDHRLIYQAQVVDATVVKGRLK